MRIGMAVVVGVGLATVAVFAADVAGPQQPRIEGPHRPVSHRLLPLGWEQIRSIEQDDLRHGRADRYSRAKNSRTCAQT